MTILEFCLSYLTYLQLLKSSTRGGSRAAATSKMERFLIIVNDFQPLTIIKKRSILEDEAALDPPLTIMGNQSKIQGDI